MNIRLLSLLMASCVVSSFSICQGQDKSPAPLNLASNASVTVQGTVEGVVLDAVTAEHLMGVHVRILGSALGSVSNMKGRFEIKNLPAGEHKIEARMIGFSPYQTTVHIKKSKHQFNLTIALEEETLLLSEIIVKPEKRTLIDAEIHGTQSLSADQIKLAAQYDEDIYRTVTRLPGLIANDFSSKFSIRGGAHDEVLVTFDGLELNDPFHLKDFGGGGMSIIDSGVIGSVDLLTGAFPAEFGDRLSGVFQIRSAEPASNQGKSSLGLSFMNARAFSQGTFGDGNTQWMFSGRRGYLDFLLDLTHAYTSYSPRFFDVFGKISHHFGNKHKVALEGLLSGDNLDYLDVTDPNDQVHSAYGNGYLWLNWQTVWSARLFSQTLFSRGRIWRDRDGVDVRRDKLISFQARDQRMFNAFQFKQDWTYEAGVDHQVKWGISIKHQQSKYRYSNSRLIQDVVAPLSPRRVVNRYAERSADPRPAGVLFNLYTSHRVRLGERFIGEVGGRFGYATWTNDRYLDPRINVTYTLSERSALHGGWGFFHQPQGIEQLYVEDGDQHYYAAERSQHLVVGLDHQFSNGFELLLDIYNKHNTNARPRYISLAGEAAAFFPELDEDRVFWQPQAVRAKGLEATLRKENGRRLNGLFNYTLSKASEVVGGAAVPKSFDQRHAVLIDLDFKPWSRFHVNLSWQYHTGWRYSDVDFEVTYQRKNDVLFDARYGSLNGRHFPAYHKLDLRLSQLFKFKQQTIAAYVEVRNLYNRKNIRLYSYKPVIHADGTVNFNSTPEYWLPRLPAFGLKWDIVH